MGEDEKKPAKQEPEPSTPLRSEQTTDLRVTDPDAADAREKAELEATEQK